MAPPAARGRGPGVQDLGGAEEGGPAPSRPIGASLSAAASALRKAQVQRRPGSPA